MENTPRQSEKIPRRDRRAVLGLLLGLPLLAVGTSADAIAQARRRRIRRFREMQDQVRELVRSGDVLPLRQIVRTLNAKVDGDVLDVAFHQIEGAYFYQFKILSNTGRIEDYFVDAKTTQVLTLAEARELFPQGIAGIMDPGGDGNGVDSPAPDKLFDNLPERVRAVLGDIEARIDGKIVDYKLRRAGNSRIFRIDVLSDTGKWHGFFVNARTGVIRTPDEAREAFARRFPRLFDEFFPEQGGR
jgi:uncharacterized membrane protein YkoI